MRRALPVALGALALGALTPTRAAAAPDGGAEAGDVATAEPSVATDGGIADLLAAPAPTAAIDSAAGKPVADAHAGDKARPRDAKEAKVEVGGRIFFRANYGSDGSAPNTSDMKVASARLEASLHWAKRLRAEVEAELAGKPRIKDAFVQAMGDGFQARAGQFKMPISVIETESAFTLPTARRGLLHDLLSNKLQVAGRRPGVMLGWNGGQGISPKLRLGAFQPMDGNASPLQTVGAREQAFAARLSIEPGPVEIGLAAGSTTAEPLVGAGVDRNWVADGDLKAGFALGRSHLRLWAEALVGSSSFSADVLSPEAPTFVAGRAVLALRRGGEHLGDGYGEIHVMAGALDPDTAVTTDLIWEGMAGLGVGYWQRMRVTLEGEIARAQRNAPLLLAVVESSQLILFVGATF